MDQKRMNFHTESDRDLTRLRHPWVAGRLSRAGSVLAVLVLIVQMLTLTGCEEDSIHVPVDNIPPAVPTGVFSVTGDEEVTIYWHDLYYEREVDLVLYRVYRSEDGPQGDFFQIGVVAWDENFDPDFGLHWFVDDDVANGLTYDYAVTAEDDAGNESSLSFEDVFDTPRPAMDALSLWDYATVQEEQRHLAGFDFSDWAEANHTGYMDPTLPTTADIMVVFEEVPGGARVPFVYAVRSQVRLQDYGTVALDWVDWAPEDGYSTVGKLELIQNHSYVVEIQESPTDLNYAKIEVADFSESWVVLNLAYQPVDGSPELKAAPDEPQPSGEFELIRF